MKNDKNIAKPTIKGLALYLQNAHDQNLSFYDILENYEVTHDLHLSDSNEPLPDDVSDHDLLLNTLLHFAADRNL